MSEWNDVDNGEDQHDATGTPGWNAFEDDTAPFGGVERVDGLVYAEDQGSPELQWQDQQVDVPLPPVRQAPQRPLPTFTEPWKPGPDPEPVDPNSGGLPPAARIVLVALIPLLLLAGLGYLVLQVMNAYGFR